MLHNKGATKTACKNAGSCKVKTQYFSSLYPYLKINVIFPIFIFYPLHLNILLHKNKTKRVRLMLYA